MKKVLASILSLTMFFVILSITGCKKDSQKEEQAIAVNAIKVEKTDQPLNVQYPAQIAGSLEIDIRAQVGGILKSRNYMEGSYVEKGTLLFVIDPQPYQVALEKAKGNLAQVESDVKRTKREYNRMSSLFKQNAISAKEHDDSLSAYEKAQANLLVAKAEVQDATINLGYTNVVAPISGVAGKEAQSVGSLISPSSPQASLLTNMIQTDPLYINFSIPSIQWSLGPKVMEAGNINATAESVSVQIILDDGSIYPELGKIFFVDSSENSKTASVAIKAQIPNPKRTPALLPGKFVKVKVIGLVYRDAIVIPTSAISHNSSGSYVYVVGEDDIIVSRPVKAISGGNNAMINEGLKVGDVIVAEGLVKIRPGQKVAPKFIENTAEKDSISETTFVENTLPEETPAVAGRAVGKTDETLNQVVDNDAMAPSVAPEAPAPSAQAAQ